MASIDYLTLLGDIIPRNLDLNPKLTKDHNGKVSFILENLGTLRQELKKVENIGIYDSEIARLKTGSIFIGYPDVVELDEKTFSLITENLSTIKLGILGIRRYLNYQSEEEVMEEVINIRLPHTDDFDALAKNIEELKKIITIPLRSPNINATTKILKGDEGSVVLVIAIAASTIEIARRAYRFIAEIQWSSYVISKKRSEAKMADIIVKSMELDLSIKEAVAKGKEDLIKKYVKNEADGIAERFEIGEDLEVRKRIELAITTLDKFNEKGGELLPGPFAPEDVKNLFLPKGRASLVESRIGKLGTGEGNS